MVSDRVLINYYDDIGDTAVNNIIGEVTSSILGRTKLRLLRDKCKH